MNAIPTVTKNLLIINVLVFLATIVAQSYGLDLARYLGLHFFLADNFNIAQLITYMFMHGGFTHLFFNMFALWMFGRILEQVWGPKRFLFYYLVCGIGAGFIQEIVQYVHYEMVLSAYTSVNTATFVGYKNRGIPGAIAATLGVIAPSLVIIMIIAAFISNFIELSAVSSAFAGIRACVCVLIGSAVVKLAKKSLVDKGAIAIAAVVFVLSLFTSVFPALLVVVAGAIGIVLKGGKGEKK